MITRTIDIDICNRKPVIDGTRIIAKTVLELLAAGDSIEDVLEAARVNGYFVDENIPEKMIFALTVPVVHATALDARV